MENTPKRRPEITPLCWHCERRLPMDGSDVCEPCLQRHIAETDEP